MTHRSCDPGDHSDPRDPGEPQPAELDWDDIGSQLSDHPRALARVRRVVERYASFNQRLGMATPEITHWRHLTLEQSLGHGSFGQVYRAYDPHLRRYVALKLLPAGDQTESWLTEARRLARVRHPNVIGIHGAELDGQVGGIWMDLVEGSSAEQLLKSGALPGDAVHELALALADALAAVHDAQLVHGDVKASNVMIEPSGQVTLLDFGAALETAIDALPLAASPLTAAPEVLNGQPAGPSSDMYSLGVLLVRLFSDRYPFSGNSLEQLRQIQRGSPELTGVPAPYRGLIERLLNPIPEHRPTARQVIQSLAEITELPRRRRKKRRLATAFSGLMTLVVVTGGGWYLTSQARQLAELESSRSRAALAFLQQVLGASFSGRFGKDAPVVDVLEHAHRQASAMPNTDPYVLASVEYTVGGAYLEIGREEAGLELIRASLARLKQLPSANPADLARMLIRLGLTQCIDDSAQGQEILDELSPMLELLPPNHPARRGELKLQACLAEQSGDLAAAELFLRQAVDARPPTAARATMDDWGSALRLALLLRDQGRIDEARPLLVQSHAGLSQLVGDDHDITLGAARDLASAMIEQSDFAQAASLLDVTLSRVAARRGLRSRSWIATANTQSIVLAKVKRFDEALALNQQVVEVATEVLGGEHPFTLTALTNLGIRHKDAGQLDLAEQVMEQSVNKNSEILGKAHRLTLVGQINLAELWLLQDQPRQALELASQTLDEALGELGDTHAVTAGARAKLARALSKLGRLDEAENQFQRAVATNKSLGQRSLDALETELFFVELLLKRQSGEAAAMLAGLELELTQRLGDDHELTQYARKIRSKVSPQNAN